MCHGDKVCMLQNHINVHYQTKKFGSVHLCGSDCHRDESMELMNAYFKGI